MASLKETTIDGKVLINSTGTWNDTQALLTVGNGGDGRIQTRHIWGKSADNNNTDHLWLQYANGSQHVQIGASGGGNNLYVAGSIYAGGYFSGNLVLNASNYSSYALPLTGGTVSSLNITNALQFNGTTTWQTAATTQLGNLTIGHSLWQGGKKLYADEDFNSGTNATALYNNNGGTALTIVRTAVSTAPNSSGYVLRLSYTTGASNGTSPGFGGFYFGNSTRANAKFVARLVANIPSGRTLQWTSNAYGTNGSAQWLTSTAGTGKWEEYAILVNCGDSGTLSSTNFFYISGGSDTSFTWDVASATVFDVTNHYESVSRVYTADLQMVAPIFYDKDNTNYYLDPAASTSLNIAGQITTNRSSGTLLSIAGADTIGYNDTSGRGAYIKGTAGTYVYGGALYYDGSAIRQILYEDTWLNNKYFDDNGAIYGLIFYDANNSNYYLDPAGASVLNGLRFAPSGNNVSGNDAIISIVKPDDADWAIQVSGGREYGIDLNMAATHTYAFRSLKAGTEYFRIGSDYLYHDTSIRAPIFYDTNDTNYYVDPTNISVLSGVRAPSIGSSYTNHFQIREANGGNGITTDSYAPSIGFHWAGVVASNITLESSGRISIRNNPGTAYENFIANIVYGSSSVQTPIVYDSNNTNYYLDPASTSNLVGLTVANTISGSISGNAATATTSTRISDAAGSLRIANPGGAAYSTSSSSVTGAIKIKLPTAAYQSTTMMRFTVRIYEYAGSSSGTSRTLEIGGYNYSDGQWYNFFATQNTMGGGEINVRFGNDGASNCVWIGNTDTVWAYPQVSVTDFQAGFNNATTAIWSTGWTISFITTFDTVTNGPIIAAKPLNSQNYSAYSSFSGVIKGDAGANYPHSFTNTDSGNTHWTNRNDRLLTSNGTNWATDGRDPIMALVTSGNSNATTIANSIGLTLHNESQTNNTFSPAITFSNRSNSGNYNSVYAAIIGKKTGQGVDSNWSAGELHFYTMPVGAYENDVPSLLINSAGNVGIGTTNPATLFQIGTGTPTSATGGLQFGDDTGTRIYRSGSNTLTMGGTFVATTFSGTLSGNASTATASTATNGTLPTSWSIGIIEEANVKPFLFGTLGDLLAFRTISNLQYWTGSAWQSYTNSGIQQLLTGNIQSTNASVAPTNRKFRFEFTAADAYIGGGILVVHQAWNNGAHQISSMLEYWNGSSWITVITERSSTGGGGENDYHFYNRGNIHGNWTQYRVTITSADTTNNTSYTGIQLLYDYTRANLPNNFLPFSWDYLRNVTLGARLNAFDMVSKQYIYVRHIEGKNWDTYDTTASGLYLNYASNQPVYIGSSSNLALHAGNYSGYSSFSGSVISGYGSFASPGHIIGDAQYGLYVASGNLYYKSASSGIHYWRNTADSANVMQLSNAGNLLLFGDGTNKFGIGFASAGENTYSIQHSGTSNKLLLGNDVSGTEYTTMTLTAAASSAGGNVGIGTTSPAYKLEVSGTGYFSNNLTANGVTIGASDIRSSSNILTLGGTSEIIRITGGNVGIGNTNPATLLQIGTGTPTSATSGIQFGDDTGTRIYRGTTNQIRTSGNLSSGGYLQTLTNEIYPNGWAGTLNIYCGNSAQNAWISGIELSPGGNVRIPGGLVNSGLSAQWSVSGGGTVTFNGSSVLWSQRVIAIPVEKTEFSAQGYIDINCPTSGTVTYYNSSDVTTTVTCTANGIPLGAWEALYYEITPGQTNTSDQTKFRVVAYPNFTWRPSSNWLLLAIRNSDSEVVRWIPGQANIKSGGSYDFSRATEYFYADNYYLNGATSTFIRSNGPFNFLTNAGGAQAGKFANIQVSSSYSGTLPTDGILFGTDTNLYRNSADVLKTDDSLIINSKCAVATSISATYTVDINGSLHYTSASASSDARFKKNIEPINDALNKLNNVRGVKFEWNEFVNARRNGYVLNKPTLGVIAQELEAVFPELVDHWHLSDDCPDARAVNYEKIIPVLIEAVKELNNKNIQLEARLSALESKLQ